MTAPGLPWDDFRLVKTIAQAKGLAGAAEQLGVNHSTVFRRLGQLEESLGVKLFERHRNGCALTAAGKEMAVLAERMDEDVANFTRKLAGQALTPAGELRVTSEVRSAQALSLERGLQRAPCVLRGRRLAAAPQHEEVARTNDPTRSPRSSLPRRRPGRRRRRACR